MKLKGSRTEKNLVAAFAGESQARNRYTFYAGVASKEGHEGIASIFLEDGWSGDGVCTQPRTRARATTAAAERIDAAATGERAAQLQLARQIRDGKLVGATGKPIKNSVMAPKAAPLKFRRACSAMAWMPKKIAIPDTT